MADLKVFSAGVAMRLAKQAVEAFEAEHPELDVEFSGGGSVAGVNRLLGGEDLDVLILADQTAIDEQLMPDFADGYFVWGGNEMCITGKGINSDNWKEVLLDPASEVKHTNPYDDPSGYRAVMAMMLADHVEEGLSEKLLHHPKYKGLDREQYKRNPFGPPPGGPGGKGPGRPGGRGGPGRRPGLPPLKDGEYRFTYLSGPSSNGAEYAKLPPEMSQGDPAYEDLYNSVTFTVDGGKVVKGTTVLHAIMIAKHTAHREAAEAFVKEFLKTDFVAKGFTPVQKAVGNWTL